MTQQQPERGAGPSAGQGWSLRRRTGVGFAVLGLVVALVLASGGLSLANFISAGNDVNRWAKASVTGQALLADLLNQELGVRGYALSARPELLEPYRDYENKQHKDTAALRKQLAGDTELQRDLDRLVAATERWRTGTAEPLIRLVEGGDPAARVRADSAAGRAAFDEVRQRAGALSDAIDHRTEQAVVDRSRAAIAVAVAIAITGVLAAASATAVWLGLHWWVLSPVDRLGRQTRDVAEGDVRRAIRPSGPPEFAQLGSDVETMRLRILDELDRLEEAGRELARSNADLERFAYVASHDLSEPLRKVSNFCQLLERQYGPQLDDRARQYIAYAVDGAKRMQALISDLLSLSRVGRATESFEPVDLEQVVEQVCVRLQARIREIGASVEHDNLPTVPGDEALLGSLFENLIGNALKYRGDAPQHVRITAERDAAHRTWMIIVADNGIGIDPQYAERIFAIFQRLHLRDEFGGTGIGLALCRRIVEFHGGQIWLDTNVRTGATFRFTLPEGER
jgi:signal transduction histidine kinase